MGKITAQEFFKNWIKVINSMKDELVPLWRQSTIITSKVRSWDEKSVLMRVANELKLKCYPQDYYSIDAVFYKDEDLAPGSPSDSYWFRNIRVAFEHENIFNKKLYEEISHLLITVCELRVLVAYPQYPFKEMEEFGSFHKIIQETTQSKAISEEQSFLLICGYETGYTWEGFTYDENEKWKQVEL